jgi:hypothetical protein
VGRRRLPPSNTALPDQDFAGQVRPGHGVPSQDPSAAAQFAPDPREAAREAKSALTGGGGVGSAAIGATIGVMVAGPVGVVLGGTLGAVAGALGGAGAGGMVAPDSASGAKPEVTGRAPASAADPSRDDGSNT